MHAPAGHTGIFFTTLSFSFSFPFSLGEGSFLLPCEFRAVVADTCAPFLFPQLLKPHLDLRGVSWLTCSTFVRLEPCVSVVASRRVRLPFLLSVSLLESDNVGLNSQYFKRELCRTLLSCLQL